ncbi:DUF3654 domain-containing protein [Encephalitozoon hellem]|uniref:DUF3654 domain-containing protein n=1 Tax=Encephalitozoon hellem TaxID=27973 RepID=A0ABY8CQS4_ENCHE|nr:DUF3654 domain-containing protein [Encephalitozoon hellem]
MRWDVFCLVALVYRALCTSLRQEKESDEIKRSIMVVLPLAFLGNTMALQPTISLRNLKTVLSKDAYSVVDYIVRVICMYNFSDVVSVAINDEEIERLFLEEIRKYLKVISGDVLKKCKESSTLYDIVEIVFEEMLEYKENAEGVKMSKLRMIIERELGEKLKVIESLANVEMSEEGRRKYELRKLLNIHIRSFLGILCLEEQWEQRVAVQKIVCSVFKNLYSRLKREQILGIMVEGNIGKQLRPEYANNMDEFSTKMYLEIINVRYDEFLGICNEYDEGVVEEIVKQILLGKDGRSIDRKYAEKVKNMIERRREKERKVEERKKELAERNARKLLEEEERDKAALRRARGGTGKGKGGSRSSRGKGKRSGKRDADNAERTEDVEDVEAPEDVHDEKDVEAPEDVHDEKDVEAPEKEGSGDVEDVVEPYQAVHSYGVHRRVLVWRKDEDSIARWWNESSETRWKNRPPRIIREQKKKHNIMEVLELFRSKYRDCFFKKEKYDVDRVAGRNRWQSVSVARFWECGQDSEKLGIVEIGTFESEGGTEVIYHLLFKEMEKSSIKEVMKIEGDFGVEEMSGESAFHEESLQGRGRWDGWTDDGDSSKDGGSEGMGCLVIRKPPFGFTVEWRGAENEVVRRLTMVPREEVIS